jgi:hypothetical protein
MIRKIYRADSLDKNEYNIISDKITEAIINNKHAIYVSDMNEYTRDRLTRIGYTISNMSDEIAIHW